MCLALKLRETMDQTRQRILLTTCSRLLKNLVRILATSVQMRTIRPYNLGDDANIHPSDIMERVKLLENCISNQNKTIQNLIMKLENMEQKQG